jgi:hypothetical protein
MLEIKAKLEYGPDMFDLPFAGREDLTKGLLK